MKIFAALVTLIVATVAAHAADSTVTFQNNIFTPARLVTFDSSFGPLAGSGVRNNAVDLPGEGPTYSYVAQLVMVAPGGVEISVGAPANFRAATTTQPGTWAGGTRTLVGVEPGTAVNLKVNVWDTRYSNVEEARSAYWSGPWITSPAFGYSEVFSYTQPNPILLPSDTYMTGFSGFQLTHQLSQNIPEPSSVALFTVGLSGLIRFRRR